MGMFAKGLFLAGSSGEGWQKPWIVWWTLAPSWIKNLATSGWTASNLGMEYTHYIYIYTYIYIFFLICLISNTLWYVSYYRRKFRSQTSDNMDTWKADMGRVGEESQKRKSEKVRRKKMQARANVGKSPNKVFFQCFVALEGQLRQKRARPF